MRVLLLITILTAAEITAAEIPLFDGRSLAGWVHEGPLATFTVSEGAISTSGRGNHPNWLRTEKEYENFRLSFDYNLAQWAEAAVILRAPRAGRPIQAGIAVMLADDFHGTRDTHITGAIAGALPPRRVLPRSFAQWHTVSIVLDGNRLQCAIDGVEMQNVQLDEHESLRWRPKRGHIGFPDMGYRYQVRNIRIQDLGDRLHFVRLFDGRSLAGWQLREEGNWMVRDGVIYASNGSGILYAPPSFGDFELSVYVRSHGRANGGIFLRGEPEGPNRGFEVQIYSPPDGVYPTGSIYGMVRSNVSVDFEDCWFLMQVIVRNRRCIVLLDGVKVAETEDLPARCLAPGRIGFQIHSENASLEFSEPRVLPLDSSRH